MPYYQRSWNVLLGDQAPRQTVTIRTAPATEQDQQAAAEEKQEEEKPLYMDLRKVFYMRNALKKSVSTRILYIEWTLVSKTS